MAGDRHGRRDPDPGVLLQGLRVLDTVEARLPAVPEVAVERHPEPRPHVVAEVDLDGPDRILGLGLRAGAELRVVREELGVLGEEPGRGVGAEDPVAAKRLGEAQLGLERPPVRAEIDELGRVVLARRSDHLEAHSEQGLLPPLPHLRQRHRRPSHQVHGDADDGVEEARAVDRPVLLEHPALERADTVGHRGEHVCRAAEEPERAVVGGHRHAELARGVLDGDGALEKQLAGVVGAGERDGVRPERGDHVSARGEILGVKRGGGPGDEERREGKGGSPAAPRGPVERLPAEGHLVRIRSRLSSRCDPVASGLV